MEKIHHSLTDWNFQPGMGLGIGTDQYISSPSSLKLQYTYVTGRWLAWIFLKSAVRQKIESGRFITYHRINRTAERHLEIYFWNQGLPTNQYPDNSYFIEFSPYYIDLKSLVDTEESTLERVNRNYEWNVKVWYRYRVTWFIFVTASLAKVLKIIVDVEQDGEWVEKMNYSIADLPWLDSDTKLVGFLLDGTFSNPAWVDDTEIWEKMY